MALAFKLDLDKDLPKAFRRLATNEIGKTCERLGAPADEREEAIHNARKGLKKVRALVKLARPSLDGTYDALNGELREVGRGLSGARDATALIECLDKLEAAFGNRLGEGAFAVTRRVLTARRDAVLADTAKVGSQIEGSISRLGALRQLARNANWPRSKGDLEADFERSYRACRKAWKAVRKDAGGEAAHEWRKRTKALSAQIGLLRSEIEADIAARREALIALGERLGDHHDLTVLEAAIVHEPGVPAEERKLLEGLIEAERRAIRRFALGQGERLLREKPAAFARSLRAG
jgi:CHAD domain-containing protein